MGVDKATGRRTVRKAAYGQGSRWQVSFYAEQADGTLAIRSKNFERKNDADAFRTRTEHEARAGIYTAPADVTRSFAVASQAWWESKRRPNGASLHRYRDALDIWVLPQWGARNLVSISRPDIETWVTQLVIGTARRAADRRVRGQGLSPAGLRAVWVPFSATLAHAQRLGWVT